MTSFFLHNIYEKHLTIIKGINFTHREIAVISCLLNVRGTSKISSLLSISPHTVLTHTRNIMLKIGCNSRETIIDFVERSSKLSIIKKYYASLVIHSAFEKSLKDISRFTRNVNKVCLIHYGESQSHKRALLNYIPHHLKQAGLHAEFWKKEEDKILESISDKSLVLVLLLEKEDQEKIPKELLGINFVDVSKYQNYYFLVFEILKKLLPNINLGSLLTKFIEQYEGMRVFSENQYFSAIKDEILEKSESGRSHKEMPILKNKKLYFFPLTFCVCLLCSVVQIFKGNKEMQIIQSPKDLKEHLIRSDLPIPAHTVLLQRPKEIKQINEKLKDGNGIQAIALIGPGGAGKTILSRQYAHQQKARAIWEINAETHETLKSSFEDLAEALATTEKDQKILVGLQDIKNPVEREKKLIEFVKKRLRAHSPWFLIYDNVGKFQDIQKYFPQDVQTWGQGKIILTTRNSNIRNNKHVTNNLHIGELSPNQKLDLFMKIMTNGDTKSFTQVQIREAKYFLEKIPPYPLDVSIAAYYLKTANIPYIAYLESLNKNNNIFTKVQENILNEVDTYNKARYSIITLSLQHLIHNHKNFSGFLLFISLLDSQDIPRDLLDRYISDKNIVDDFIYNLKKYSLITNHSLPSSPLGSTFSMHRSTQAISLAYLIKILNLKTNNQLLPPIIESLEKYTAELIEKEDLPKLRSFINHCEIVLSHTNLLSKAMKSAIAGELGGIYLYLGNYEKAKQILEKDLLTSNHLNNKSLGRARAFAYLGNVYGDLGDYEKAKSLLEQSLVIYKKYFPENYTGTARALTSLGNVHRDIGNYEKAKDFLKQSFSVYKQHLLENHMGTARASAYLGIVYKILGNYEEAKDLLESSLSIYKKHLSKNGIGVAWVLAHLGDFYGYLREYEKAKTFLEQSVSLYKEYFPEGHIKTGWALSCLGDIYRNLGEYKKAEKALEESLQIYKKHLSDNHIVVAGILVYLGAVYKDLGRYEEAKDLLEQSLLIYKKHFPEDHNEIAWALAHLGETYKAKGDLEKAKLLLEKSIKIYEKHFPETHNEVIWASKCLRDVYRVLGNR